MPSIIQVFLMPKNGKYLVGILIICMTYILIAKFLNEVRLQIKRGIVLSPNQRGQIAYIIWLQYSIMFAAVYNGSIWCFFVLLSAMVFGIYSANLAESADKLKNKQDNATERDTR